MKRLGVDVGGSGIKGGIVDLETGTLVTDRFRIPTPESANPTDVAEVVASVAAHHEWDGALGCTIPGVVTDGIVLSAANIGPLWVEADGQTAISRATGKPVTLLNDADAAGLAEMRYGVGVGRRGVVVLLTFGTGIGSAVFTEGTLVTNTELGHLQLWGDSAEKRAAAKAYEDEQLSYEEWTERVNEYLAYLESLLWPELIIVGGGISKHSDEFIHMFETRAEIVPAKLLNNAGIVGAALASAREHP